IIEFGSGEGTKLLTKRYKVFSIEHDKRFLNQHHENYIYAPLINHYEVVNLSNASNVSFGSLSNNLDNLNLVLREYSWYDTFKLRESLPQEYSLIIIDGPPGNVGRFGFLYNLELFNTNVIMLFDDTERMEERFLVNEVARILGKRANFFETSLGKGFAVIV
ncbi:MAG: hypothetical protein SFU25_09240, partial [Candidatus Caenarcaniphilales bacterium]|nr:hypothetical protein [Candidatus Caenarcaniphilales bacterium]